MPANRLFLLTALAWLGYALLLGVVPWIFPPEADLPNTASMQGYNIALAYLLIAGWTVAAMLIVRSSSDGAAPAMAEADTARALSPLRAWTERGVVGLGIALFYWPAALARFGPHVEDTYFLAALWRMACGEAPYADFEFLYGPLMIFPLGAWIQATGFSMTAYYSFYMISQVLFYVALVAILQRYLPRAGQRYLAFFLLLPFVFDILLGLNWIAWRYFAAVPVILVLAARPRALGAALAGGALIGLSTAYSYEYGIAMWLAALVMLAVLLFEPRRGPVLRNAAALTATALAVWFLSVWVATGGTVGAYLAATAHVVATATALGLGQFAFFWTLHSLALFALLAAVVVMGGIGLRRLGRASASAGDLQIIGAAAFAVIVLKIAFQRADYLHLAVPFVPLMVMILLNAPRRLMATAPHLRTLALAAIAVAALAQIIGHAPIGRWIALGSARGMLHEVTGRPTVGEIPARGPSILRERSAALPASAALAARLAEPDLTDRPVLYYGRFWKRAMQAGTCPVGYSFYDILYSDDRVPLADTVAGAANLIIVMHQEDYARLFEGALSGRDRPTLNRIQQLGRWTSSIHFSETLLEEDIEYDMWKASIGDMLTETYRASERIADMVLLERVP